MVKPVVFLAHSSKDREQVQDLVLALRKQDIGVNWAGDFQSGEEWEKARVTAIRQSTHFLWAMSRNSVASPQVRKEFDEAGGAGIARHVYCFDDVDSAKAQGDVQKIHWVKSGRLHELLPRLTHKRPILKVLAIVLFAIAGAGAATSALWGIPFDFASESRPVKVISWTGAIGLSGMDELDGEAKARFQGGVNLRLVLRLDESAELLHMKLVRDGDELWGGDPTQTINAKVRLDQDTSTRRTMMEAGDHYYDVAIAQDAAESAAYKLVFETRGSGAQTIELGPWSRRPDE